MQVFARFVRRLFSGLFALIALIGGALNGDVYVKSGNVKITRRLSYPYSEGISFCQGLACDGKYFYGFGAVKALNYNAITVLDAATGEIVKCEEMCIPVFLMRKGYSHIGDGCIEDGKLYIALEDYGFRHPGVIVYDAETLEFLEYHVLPDECRGNGRIPWCEIKDGILYFSQSNEVDELRMICLSDFSFIGTIPLDTTLYKVQGGEFCGDALYMVTNQKRKDKTVYAVDIVTGEVKPYFVRCTGRLDAEGEGIAVYPLEDGSLFHILDVGATVRLTSFSEISQDK
ncbi:MAG: hypothetical protein K6F09_05285 [Clostridiales bacterium]|nr:hypothetical protein [Clostridiales bacterium]